MKCCPCFSAALLVLALLTTTISTPVAHGTAGPGSAELSLPDTYALSFQTGIAADTLLIASYRKANWSKAQIAVKVPASALLNIDTSFADSDA